MPPISALDVVQVWEWGRDRHAVDRAVAMMLLADPAATEEEALAYSVGQRNAILLTLREHLLGSTLNGYAECPRCDEPLEFTVPVATLRVHTSETMARELDVDGIHLHFRLPDSRDMAAIVGLGSVEAGRRLLIERCVVQATRDGRSLHAASLSDDVVPALANAVLAADPQAEMRFALDCPACGHGWSALFDIVTFLWTELDDRVKRLMMDVHVLARAYGWREADILAMSPTRRRFYLDLVS